MGTKIENPVFCALDMTDVPKAVQLADRLSGSIGGLKIGMEFFYAAGFEGCQKLAAGGLPMFLDLKLHDIPNTVAAAVRTLCPLRPAILNVHAAGGPDMMRAACRAAEETANHQNLPVPLMIAVTVLTSLDRAELQNMGMRAAPHEQVLRLADLAQQAGMGGVVCSAHEVEALRKQCGPDFKLVVPGIRPAGLDTDDQKRVMTPQAALAAGADILVVGRAITQAPDPVRAAAEIHASLGTA